MDFYTSWEFLRKHKMFVDMWGDNIFLSTLSVDVVKVNPETNSIDRDRSKNTKVQVWLETGPYIIEDNKGYCTHDIELDCSGDTFEEAIIKLAELVKKYYTDDGQRIYIDEV